MVKKICGLWEKFFLLISCFFVKYMLKFYKEKLNVISNGVFFREGGIWILFKKLWIEGFYSLVGF